MGVSPGGRGRSGGSPFLSASTLPSSKPKVTARFRKRATLAAALLPMARSAASSSPVSSRIRREQGGPAGYRLN